MLMSTPEFAADQSAHDARTCISCGNLFTYAEAEQAFRREHRLADPLLCPNCRQHQRTSRNADLIAIYEKASGTDVAMTAGAPRQGRGAVKGQMYATVCDACGAETKVPFVPRGDRPVFCRDCFNARKGR